MKRNETKVVFNNIEIGTAKSIGIQSASVFDFCFDHQPPEKIEFSGDLLIKPVRSIEQLAHDSIRINELEERVQELENENERLSGYGKLAAIEKILKGEDDEQSD